MEKTDFQPTSFITKNGYYNYYGHIAFLSLTLSFLIYKLEKILSIIIIVLRPVKYLHVWRYYCMYFILIILIHCHNNPMRYEDIKFYFLHVKLTYLEVISCAR